jgi:hypothetical protein
MFYEIGEQLEKRGMELTSLSNEISSLVGSQTALIQDLAKMSSNQVMYIYYYLHWLLKLYQLYKLYFKISHDPLLTHLQLSRI